MKKVLSFIMLSVVVFTFTLFNNNVEGKNVYLNDNMLSEYLCEMDIYGVQVSKKEYLLDFNNNEYYLFELSPN